MISCKSNCNVVFSNKHHVVWCPKYRRQVLVGAVDARLVKRVKGRSSRLLRQEFAGLRSCLPTLWTNSYFVSTAGRVPLQAIKQYIEQQKNA